MLYQPRYKTETVDTHDGSATFGLAYAQLADGRYTLIGQTNNYRTYPRAVRAADAAKHLCRQHAKRHFPLHTFTVMEG